MVAFDQYYSLYKDGETKQDSKKLTTNPTTKGQKRYKIIKMRGSF